MQTQSDNQDRADQLRATLVQNLVNRGVINSPAVRQAFEKAPRHLFVPRVDVETAYSDQPVFIRWDEDVPISSSTQPAMMAIMIEQLRLEPGHRVLEIGAGTGYNAAIISEMVGRSGSVATVDIDQDIVDEAASYLSQTGYGNVRCVCGDGFDGLAAHGPYDRIIATVGAHDISPHWVDQLTEGGIVVSPLWFRGFTLSVALQKRAGELRGLSAAQCTFIRIRGMGQRTEGFYPVGDPANDALRMSVGLERDDTEFRRDLDRLLAPGGRLYGTGRYLEGRFHHQDISSGLYMSLTADPRVFIVYSGSEGNAFQGLGYALVDPAAGSAAILPQSHPAQAVIYGNETAYHRLMELVDRWDNLGRPSIHDLGIRAFFDAPPSIPTGHWTIRKRSTYNWMLSWNG